MARGAREPMRRRAGSSKEIADEHPGVAEFRRDLAISHSNIGIVLGQIGDTERALDSHREAIVHLSGARQ